MKAHAVLLLVVSLLLHPCVGHAAWQPNGNAVATGAADQSSPQIIPDGAGGTIITWADNRNGDYDIYAQRLDGLGVAKWAPNGVILCSAPRNQWTPKIVPDGSGGAIVAWDDYRNPSVYEIYIYAQRVNGSGVVQWTADGVALCTAAGPSWGNDSPVSLVSDGTGGAIAAWPDCRVDHYGDVYAQRVNGSGVVQWTADGAMLCDDPGPQTCPTIASDGAGGAIVVWADGRVNPYLIFAQRVNGSGVTQWTANGVGVGSNTWACLSAASVIPDGAGGVIVAWQDYRDGPDIYAQRLNASGVAQWNVNGVGVATGPSNQGNPQLVSHPGGGAIVAWSDDRSGNADIYAQRLDASGVAQWTLNGVDLCSAVGDQFFPAQQPVIASDGAGGAYVTWEDDRSGVGDIYMQQVRGNGLTIFPPYGVALCSALGAQGAPVITHLGSGTDAVVTWQDARSGTNDVYALPVPNTPIGPFDRVVPYPNGIIIAPDPHIWPVRVLFNNVIAAGFTYLDITPAGPSLPRSFVLGDGRYYNLGTTAGTTDNIDVCIKFDPAALQHPAAALRVFEYNVAGPAGPTWLDVTTGTAAGDSICGTTTHLSTFVIGFPSVTGVGDTPTPASFALHPNLPNPFNPITTIHYDVPAPGADVNISIYDVSGRLIRSLVKEHRGAGAWSVQWNGDNDRGQGVASGVYFYRMRAGEFVETKKMVLLK